MEDRTYDIRVQVATSYVDEQSEPESGRFVFTYTITISNDGNVPARLISRHWVIERRGSRDAGGRNAGPVPDGGRQRR